MIDIDLSMGRAAVEVAVTVVAGSAQYARELRSTVHGFRQRRQARVAPELQEATSVRQLVQGDEGEDLAAGERWDAHAEHDIGTLIERYLSENPPPPGASCSEPFGRWAGQLHRSGRARLASLGERRLRAL